MKRFSITCVFVLLAFLSYSQAKVELGIKSGVKLANGDAGSFDTNSFIAFQAGVFSLFKFSKFGLQPEVLWSRQGAEFDQGQDFDLNYINVPIMFKYYLASGVNLQVGPQFGILIGSEDEEGNALESDLSNSDFGAVIGVGWDISSRIQLSARYIHGFSDVSDEPNLEFRHRIFQFSIGYSFIKLGN